jgi:phosphoglucosamine mutase
VTKVRKIFGTDGIRGKANIYPMTPELALQVGKAVAAIFAKSRKGQHPKFVVGKDTRLSGYMFENALTAGLLSMGADVLLVGPMPTPAIAHLTKSLDANASIMISASHNPAEDNGIKIFSADGTKLPDEVEEKIEKLILSGDIPSQPVVGDRIGRAKRIDDARGRYIEFAKNAIRNQNLDGIKIVMDCANGASYSVSPNIFQELGAEVIVINNLPDGLNINKDSGALHPEVVTKEVLKHKADVGIALDGDADRLIMVDETGEVVDGDAILAIAASDMLERSELAKNTLVVTEYSNLGLDEAIKKRGGKIVRVKNGDRYVIEEMLKAGYNLGGEQSGHIIFGDYTSTGDGTIAALKIVEIMKRKHKRLSELAKLLQRYPQILLNLRVKEKKGFESLPSLSAAIDKADSELMGNGRSLIRYSGTEKLLRIMIEGKDEKKIRKLAQAIFAAAKKEIGE